MGRLVEVVILNHNERNPVARRARKMAYRFVGIQALAMIVAAFCWLLSGPFSFMSALLGGVAVVLPSLFFAYRLFRITSVRSARKIVSAFYVGEVTKMLLSAVLAVIFVRAFSVDQVPFWVGFMEGLVGFWLAPVFVKMDVSKGSAS